MFTFKISETSLDPATFMLRKDIHIEMAPEDVQDLRALKGPLAVKEQLLKEFSEFIDAQVL